MLKRLILPLSLVFLFVFTQIGAAMHEISHVHSPVEQTQPDQNEAAEQCSLCSAYAETDNGLNKLSSETLLLESSFIFAANLVVKTHSHITSPYGARAPPTTFIS